MDKLLSKGVIQKCGHEPGEYISSIFLREKKDVPYRVILNLKHLNKFVEHHHFKMETLDMAMKLMKPGAFAGSLDLKDAYYSISIWEGHTKYLKFSSMGHCTSIWPYRMSLRNFTKIIKVALSEMRKRGHESAAYLNDLYLQGDTLHLYQANIRDTALWLIRLGFVIHPIKSVLHGPHACYHTHWLLPQLGFDGDNFAC